MASLHRRRSSYDRLFFASAAPRRGSTSQMCLHKILSIITTVSPTHAAATTRESSPETGKGCGFDLNTAFELNKETDSSGLTCSSAAAGDASGATENGGDCFDACDRVEEEENSLALLISAAEMIFGTFKDGDKSESSETLNIPCEAKKHDSAADIETNDRKLRRRSTWCAAAEIGGKIEKTPPPSPVLRSKRGRTQVLPGKYRDSVLEPLTRLSRTRPSVSPSKRRRR